MARTLLAQINYTADVAANMLPHLHHGQWHLQICLASATKLHNDRPQSTHGFCVPATANCVLLAQLARGHEASHPVVSCLSCGCALFALVAGSIGVGSDGSTAGPAPPCMGSAGLAGAVGGLS